MEAPKGRGVGRALFLDRGPNTSKGFDGMGGATEITTEALATMKVESISGSTVFVIDDDACLRAALKKLFESVGLHVELFPSGDAFLGSPIPNTAGCIVLAVRLPGMSGPKLQEELAKAGIRVPIVFLTGYGDIPMAVRAIKAGAVDFLTKPFLEQDLLDAVTTALEQDRSRRAEELKNATFWESFDSLSGREREVIAQVAAGALNKQIAADLVMSEVTVKVHRAHAMRKLRVKSVAELVRMIDACEIISYRAGNSPAAPHPRA